jgi:hypothetical protein
MRKHNTTSHDSNWTEEMKLAVWNKGTIIQDYFPSIWRRDLCGSVIKYGDHGNRDSKYGWEIDHIYPVSKGGSDELPNLQPLHWENNAKKSDTYPWICN